MRYDVILRSGLVFDGSGAPGRLADVGIRDGKVAAIEESLDPALGDHVVDATGQWVMPGFLDAHTHYDAELLLAPGLPESVRHGVTTVCIGSCSLSTIYSTPEDCADIFARVEALPREYVLDALEEHKTWSDPAAYMAHVDALPLGPNVMSFIGHSDLRVSVMGLEDATDSTRVPTAEEQERMETALREAIDLGFLGLSCMTNPWDKIGGDRVRSRPLPSTFATWKEYRRFHSILRERGAILQSAPNITTKYNAALYLWDSAGFGVRKPLKTTLITVADTKSNPMLASAILRGTSVFNDALGADIRWQCVPMPFEVYADGIDLVVFEEFGAGEEALHLTEQVERNALFADKAYRRRFRKEYDKRFGPRVWHRDLHDAHIVSAPDPTLAGRSFGEIADERKEHPVDTFLDLVMEHGTALRWRTTIANHRKKQLDEIVSHPTVQVGFADSGAHIRNMAFYNFPLYFLRSVKRAAEAGAPIMSLERAVHRVTGEIGDWLGVDAGHLKVGSRADVVVVNPAGLNDDVEAYHEAPIEVFGGVQRMVRRNDDAITATLIGGRVVYTPAGFVDGYGTTLGFGRFLKRGQSVAPRAVSATAAEAGEQPLAAQAS